MMRQGAESTGRRVLRRAGLSVVAAACLVCLGAIERAVTAPWPLTELHEEDLRPGRFFNGPVRLRVPLLGVTFAIPQPWRARLPAGSQVVHLDSARRPGLGIILVLSQVSVEDIRARLDEPLAFEESYILDPVGPVRREGPRLSASYLHGDQVGRAVAVIGPTDQAMVYILAGPEHQASHYADVVAALANSTRFMDRATTEQLATWYGRLQGTRLERVAEGEIKVWHFCSDGRFLYEFRRPGAPPGEAGFEEGGVWRIDVRDGRATVVVQSRFGIPRELSLGREAEGLTLNGARFGLARSNECF